MKHCILNKLQKKKINPTYKIRRIFITNIWPLKNKEKVNIYPKSNLISCLTIQKFFFKHLKSFE